MFNHKKKTIYADDDTETVPLLLRLRLPSLFIGLFLGIGISFLTSRFEDVLEKNIHVAFFIPFVVYLADAIGTQTETIFSRDLKTGKASFHSYLIKEACIGFVAGLLFGGISLGVVLWWFSDLSLALSVGISTFLAIFFAPLIALCTTQVLNNLKIDPAAGAGPITTVIQDATSIIIYGIVSSLFFLS
ncbi:magnesium transporter [Candidatus Uhrbacteria bacterium]|nr:magnesium transporter [Candidatus Uhrbacteria bacterium]